MSVDGKVCRARIPLATNVARERSFLHPAMHSCLFESLQGSGLRVAQPRFDTAFGESPAPAPGLNEQELDATAVEPVANGSDLFAFSEAAKV
jgi:hypothetical protein